MSSARKPSLKKPAGRLSKGKSVASDLPEMPSSKHARSKIAAYVDEVVEKSRSFSVLSRGTVVAILGPINSLPKGLKCANSITTTDIAKGRRTFGMVAHHGPYALRRGKHDVAVVYSPTASFDLQAKTLADRMEFCLLEIERIGLLVDQVKIRTALRERVDRMIGCRINLLRARGAHEEADSFKSEWEKIDKLA